MKEFLYDLPSGVIALLLFVLMVITLEVTYRVGVRRRRPRDDALTAHINAVQAALLGILALMLGFSFSLSLGRHDSRSEAVVDEANAIGTAYLRTQLLVPPIRDAAQKLFQDYVDLRVREGELRTTERAERLRLNAEAKGVQTALWDLAVESTRQDPREVTSGRFLESTNTMIDAFGKRNAAIERHVPEVVLLLLFGTFLMACASIGYASGISGHRPAVVTYVMIALIVVLVFLIVDVDRPRRGLITVSQKSMTDLQADIRTPGIAQPARPAPR